MQASKWILREDFHILSSKSSTQDLFTKTCITTCPPIPKSSWSKHPLTPPCLTTSDTYCSLSVLSVLLIMKGTVFLKAPHFFHFITVCCSDAHLLTEVSATSILTTMGGTPGDIRAQCASKPHISFISSLYVVATLIC